MLFRSFERALKLGPNLISNLSLASEFYNTINEPHQALRCTARMLELMPSYQDDILASYISGQYDLSDTLNNGLPNNPGVARAYFRVLLQNDDRESIRQAWDWLAARALSDDPLTHEYLDYLMRYRDYNQALSTWVTHLGEHDDAYLKSSFLYNGGFESEPCGSIFDWRVRRMEGVETARDSEVAHSGKWSMRIAFSGERNVSYSNLSQDVVLKPGAYRFQAYMRTVDITTDKGVAFRIAGLNAESSLNVKTEQLVRTHDWTELTAEIRVTADTGGIRVALMRESSEKFDDKIRGTVWIDDAKLFRMANNE